MMDYDFMQNMMGDNFWGLATFGWLFYLLIIIFLVLGIAAFVKYLNKK
jgi:hypothetical protein